ncbi:unnamed protein product [Symbiodinium sp. CCMP2456]|nr:unnamed protein product [Symbiodinium sp. CCMP2456]
MERMLPKMHKDLLGIVSVLWMVWYPRQVVAEESLYHLDFLPQPYSLKEEVRNLGWEYPTVPLQWKTDRSRTNVWKKGQKQERELKKHLLESYPRQEPLSWNSNPMMCPRREGNTELLSLPKVDRRGKAATPAIRPGDTSTPATGTKSKTERKEEKKAARKEEKRNRKLEKSAQKAEESEAERDPARRKLDAALENAGEEERIGLEKLREEVRAEDAEAAGMEGKRKLEELEEKRRALEEESARKQKELEDEARRLRAVEEAERRAREQRSKNPKLQVPVEAEKAEKGETWFERKATELVEGYIQAYAPQQKKSKELRKEWLDKTYEESWKVGRTIGSDEKYLECTYYPFSPEWQEKVRKDLLDLAHRGFATNADGDLCPTTRFAWQLRSTRDFKEINDSLEPDYSIRLVWKSQEVKGKSKAVDEWHCYPIGRGKMEKTNRIGVPYTVRGNLPPNKNMCSICWSEGHWKSECPLMVSELWEPALTVLVPKERLRRYYPLRNIVCEHYKDEKDEYQKYYPAFAFVDYGAFSGKISEINKKKYKDAKMRRKARNGYFIHLDYEVAVEQGSKGVRRGKAAMEPDDQKNDNAFSDKCIDISYDYVMPCNYVAPPALLKLSQEKALSAKVMEKLKSSNLFVAEQGAEDLMNKTMDAGLRHQMAEDGAFEALVAAMRQFAESKSVQYSAIVALGNLCRENTRRKQWAVRIGALGAIVTAMTGFEHSKVIQHKGVEALHSICTGSDKNAAHRAAMLRQAGGTDVVKRAQEGSPSNMGLQQTANGFLMELDNLCAREDKVVAERAAEEARKARDEKAAAERAAAEAKQAAEAKAREEKAAAERAEEANKANKELLAAITAVMEGGNVKVLKEAIQKAEKMEHAPEALTAARATMSAHTRPGRGASRSCSLAAFPGDDKLPTTFPSYWIKDCREVDEQGWILHPVRDDTLKKIEHIFRVRQPRELGRGRDAQKYDRKYTNLQVHCAWRLEHETKWGVYAAKRNEVLNNMKQIRAKKLDVRQPARVAWMKSARS